MNHATYDLLPTIDSFCAANPDDSLAAGWIPPQDRPPPIGCGTELIDFDAPGAGDVGTPTALDTPGSRKPTALSINDPIPRLMDTVQAAAYLGTSARFIRRCSADGRLVKTKVGRFNRYTAADLDRLTSRASGGSKTVSGRTHRTAPEAPPPASYDPIIEAVARARMSLPRGK